MSEKNNRERAREILTAPITWEEIEWKIDHYTGKEGQPNRKTELSAYITNRAVMERLDKAFGWDGWQNEVTEIQGGFLVKIKVLTLLEDGEPIWISKQDGANQVTGKFSPIKGGISDAMKRAAVQFGMARDLYNYPKTLLEGVHKWIPDWAIPQLKAMTELIIQHLTLQGEEKAKLKSIPEVVVITEKKKRPSATQAPAQAPPKGQAAKPRTNPQDEAFLSQGPEPIPQRPNAQDDDDDEPPF